MINYIKAKYELRASRMVLGQVGLFTLRSFSSGETVIPNSNWDEGYLIPWDEFKLIDESTKRQLIYFCYKTEEGVHAPQDINKLNIGYFVNHSCDPSLIAVEKGDYCAVRDIGIDEELTIDVEALMEKTIFSFECHCGSLKCRKTVRI